jgi:pyruvate/2-oxoglutarate dehydrogenase complex dihydrolipoamide dehydrogenase (E3) component
VSTTVDVVVLGVGTCGEDLSLRLLQHGLEVAGVEDGLVGGECAYWACLPSKRMIRMAALVTEARRAEGRAGHGAVVPDWEPVAAQVRQEITGGWDDSSAVARFGDRGGGLVRGRGRLTGPRTVAVGDEIFRARRGVVVATGSRPTVPPVPGLAEVGYWTTHDVVRAEVLPRSLLVLGGGTAGCELGQVMARFGVDVTLVEASDRLLPAEEPEASAALREALEAEGVAVRTGSRAARVDSRGGEVVLRLADGTELSSSRVLVATGRAVDLGDLGLEEAGLTSEDGFVSVDERMRAGDGVWAMGDVTGKAMTTHVALYQSAIVAADILGQEHPPARYDAVPRATFTDPEVGGVGMTEATAREAGLDVVVVSKQVSSTFRGWLHAAGGSGVVKLVLDRRTGVLVGATAVGPHGAELLGLLGLAVHTRVPLAELRSLIYAFPTFYGGVGEAVGAYGRGLATVLDAAYTGVDELDAVGRAVADPG